MEKKKSTTKNESYALQAMKACILTIQQNEILTINECEEIREILNKAISHYIKENYGV